MENIAEKNEIAVSIIVPVYNSGKHLRTCLDSLVFQTVENFEIIAVNNGSTDDSLEILNSYAERFPDKFFVYTIEHSNFVGTGRNYGLTKARGKYIYFSDSDDIVERNGVFFLYNRMKHYDLDVCYGQVNFVNLQSNTGFLLKSNGERKVSTEELILSGSEFWRRMYKKSLLDKIGPMPEDTLFDDIAYLPVVHSYSKNAMSTTRTVYNYFRRSSSTVGGVSPDIIESSIRSEKYALENSNPKYLDYVKLLVARRIIGNMTSRWIYSDKLAEEVAELWPRFSNCQLIKSDEKLYGSLMQYADKGSNLIPKTVYVANFDGSLTDEVKDSFAQNAFDECSVVVLDETNCNIDSDEFARKAKSEGDYEALGHYFALKAIYENGGFYLDRRIKITKPLNSLRMNKSVFSFIDRTTYSDWIFAAGKGSRVISDILATYNNSRYNDEHVSLAERIKAIMTVLYDVPLNGCKYYGEYVSVFSPEVLVSNIYKDSERATTVHMCVHDFSGMNPDEYTTIKYSTLAMLTENAPKATAAITTVPAKAAAADTALKEENEFLSHRVEEIEKSTSYRLALKLFKLGQKFKFLRFIVKKIMK